MVLDRRDRRIGVTGWRDRGGSQKEREDGWRGNGTRSDRHRSWQPDKAGGSAGLETSNYKK